jgi:cytoskeletal protein RodZ
MKMLTQVNFNGEILKESRLKQNKTLDELANAICSNSRQLEAIEDNNYEILKAAEIRKIIIKRYAKELGIEITIHENQ